MNNSGICSLAGYAYQIKVFVLYLSTLEEDCSIGYETFDDIAIHNINSKDDKENLLDQCNALLLSNSGITALQVKHAKLSSDDFEKVLFNWIILKNEGKNIDKFILVVDKSYGNSDYVFPSDLNALYNRIISTKKSNASLIKKVNNIINNDYAFFCSICDDIKEKYTFKEIDDIDTDIFSAYKTHFNHGGVFETVYELRIEELHKKIEYEILKNISDNKPYICNYREFKHIVENIIADISDDAYIPDYSTFKMNSNLDINSTDIVKSRQYIQLSKCNLSHSLLKEHLIFEEYYNSFKMRNLENLKTDLIGNIEETTHYNFELTKSNLIDNANDTPNNRLTLTVSKPNDYTPNNQIRNGSAIHLTKSDTSPEMLISWEDE